MNAVCRRLFVGLDNGSLEEFLVGEDYNRLDSQRLYHAHTARVTQIIHARWESWLGAGRSCPAPGFGFVLTINGSRAKF